MSRVRTTNRTPRASVRIIAPGLTGQGLDAGARTPALSRLLARSDRRSNPEADRDPIASLLRAAGCRWPESGDAPSAPVALLGEGCAPEPDGVWMHADPVHLRPDRDRLLLYTGPDVAPSRDEAEALVEAFNRHFAAAGLQLMAATPERWYLRHDRPLDGVRTSATYRLQAGSMVEHLPQGPAAQEWMRVLTETQILFHADPVNRARESRRRPIISGIWIWGAGTRPVLSGALPDALIGDPPWVTGLARLAGRPVSGLAAWRDALAERTAPAGRTLVFWDRHWRARLDADPDAWACATCELDDLLDPLWARLRQGRIGMIELDSCRGDSFVIASRQTFRVWRRPIKIQDV